EMSALDVFVQFLRDNPLMLLFLVAAIGYPLGRLRIGGASLGVAAVLFVGLAFGALDPDLKLPDVVYNLGLVLFVYTIGLSSGSVFFGSLRRQGLKSNLLVLGMLILAGGLAAVAKVVFNIKTTLAAGMFAGSLTNTPALAGVIEHVRSSAPAALMEQMAAEPVIAYSLTYPMGVLGMLLVIYILQRVWKIDYHAELEQAREFGVAQEPLENATLRMAADQDLVVAELVARHDLDVILSRLKHDGQVHLVSGQDHLAAGDLVSVVGRRDEIERVSAILGQPVEERLEFDVSVYDKRRIFISNPAMAGRKLRDLRLGERFGAIVSRVRRGDLEILPHGDTVLALGDQVRVLA
ncbi:transporter, partial [bacterium]